MATLFDRFMSTSKRKKRQPVSKVFSDAFTLVNREDILDCITAYYNDTGIDISDAEDRPVTTYRLFNLLDYKRFNGIERLAVVLLLEGEGWFDGFGVKTPRKHRSREV